MLVHLGCHLLCNSLDELQARVQVQHGHRSHVPGSNIVLGLLVWEVVVLNVEVLRRLVLVEVSVVWAKVVGW